MRVGDAHRDTSLVSWAPPKPEIRSREFPSASIPRNRCTSGFARSLSESAPLFAALGDKTRLRLVSRLCESGPLSITVLTAGSDITRQAITKHLRMMEEAGLVRAVRQGREHVWELEPERLEGVRNCLDLISKQWDDALVRLKGFVEYRTTRSR